MPFKGYIKVVFLILAQIRWMEHIQIFCTSKVSTGTVQNRHIILQARVLNIASKVRVSFHAKIFTDLLHVQLQ